MTFAELLALFAQVRERADPKTQDALAKFEGQLKTFGAQTEKDLAARDQTIAEHEKQIAELSSQIAKADEQISAQTTELAEKDSEIGALKDQLAGSTQVTRASPSDIAKSFRAVIDEFHAEAREADDVGVAIKTLDLEVKGLVEVDEQKTTFVLPSAGTAVDPTSLSTMRVSFSTFPVVTAPTTAPAPAPRSPVVKKPRARSRRPRPS